MKRRDFLSAASASLVTTLAATMVPQPARAANDPLQEILSAAQRQKLAQNGFVIASDHTHSSFTHALAHVYSNDLPLFVSADALMHAVHRSFADLLPSLEYLHFLPELTELLTSMRTELDAGVLSGMPRSAIADIDLYLAVALSLLSGEAVQPVAGAEPAAIRELVADTTAAQGMVSVELFGQSRLIDASQLVPRGHYTGEHLCRYFRAMSWLGRIDLRLLVPVKGGVKLSRREFDAAVGLRMLMDQPAHEIWLRLEQGIGAFMGAQDSMSPPQLDDLMAALSIDEPSALMALCDDSIEHALKEQEAGQQQILSHLMRETSGQPLARTFLLLGQRYTPDSHVLSAVVYGQLPQQRLMPDPLDVAYATLGNEHARVLLAEPLEQWRYGERLDELRELSDGSDDWSGSLYTAWLRCLRALSAPPPEAPAVTKTTAWSSRILSTQLASWAELRHDTLLYAKPSYTMMLGCEYPDVFIDPYPAFYDALRDYAALADALASAYEPDLARPHQRLAEVAAILGDMARQQLAGEPFTDAQMDFINQAVSLVPRGSGGQVGAAGWYTELFYGDMRSVERKCVIADVHTQPTDHLGAPVGKVLHVAVGAPRQLVVRVETCKGPRMYIGPVSAYREVITSNFERLSDAEWAGRADESDEVWWMAPLVS